MGSRSTAVWPAWTTACFATVLNRYPHNWTWHFSMLEGSPWRDVRIRKAANLAHNAHIVDPARGAGDFTERFFELHPTIHQHLVLHHGMKTCELVIRAARRDREMWTIEIGLHD